MSETIRPCPAPLLSSLDGLASVVGSVRHRPSRPVSTLTNPWFGGLLDGSVIAEAEQRLYVALYDHLTGERACVDSMTL